MSVAQTKKKVTGSERIMAFMSKQTAGVTADQIAQSLQKADKVNASRTAWVYPALRIMVSKGQLSMDSKGFYKVRKKAK